MAKSKASGKVEASGVTPDKGGLGEPLHQPEEGKEPEVDIVFVHGINGDRINSWTWENPYDSDEKIMWPRHFLPEKLPNARIVSFGYNAKVAGFYWEDQATIAPEMTIDDFSTALFEALKVLRQNDESALPIMFVAHSMGGLVVANALSQSQTSNEPGIKAIADHTIGTVFLGTPFNGSDLATYGSIAVSIYKYIAKAVQADSLKMLEKKSHKLVSISEKFAEFIKGRDLSRDKPRLNIACFFEQYAIVKDTFVVSKESAAATWLAVKPLSIEANHIDMCRFQNKSSQGYGSIAGKLTQWIKEYSQNKNAGGVGGLDNKGGIVVRDNKVDLSNMTAIQSAVAGIVVATTENGYHPVIIAQPLDASVLAGLVKGPIPK